MQLLLGVPSDFRLSVCIVSNARKDAFDFAVVISKDRDLAQAKRIERWECGKAIGLWTPACSLPTNASDSSTEMEDLCFGGVWVGCYRRFKALTWNRFALE